MWIYVSGILATLLFALVVNYFTVNLKTKIPFAIAMFLGCFSYFGCAILVITQFLLLFDITEDKFINWFENPRGK